MPQPPQIEVLSELVDVLVDCADPRARERLLARTLFERGWSQAVALFSALPEAAGDHPWTPTVTIGAEDLLLDGEVVRAIYCGQLPEELPLNKRVLFGANSHARYALVLGGFRGQEHELDLLEATFQVLAAVAEGDHDGGPTTSLVDLLQGALPGSQDELDADVDSTLDSEAPQQGSELSRLLNHMGGTESLLQGELMPLSDEDREHFGEVLERTTARAADVFGSTLEQAAAELSRFGDTCVAAQVEGLCEQAAWVLSQRGIELQLHSGPAARVFTLPTSEAAVWALLEEVLGRLFERLRRLRAGGGRIDLELERVDAHCLGLRVWIQLRRGRELALKGPGEVPAALLRDACARLLPVEQCPPGACLELRFERPARRAA